MNEYYFCHLEFCFVILSVEDDGVGVHLVPI